MQEEYRKRIRRVQEECQKSVRRVQEEYKKCVKRVQEDLEKGGEESKRRACKYSKGVFEKSISNETIVLNLPCICVQYIIMMIPFKPNTKRPTKEYKIS